MSTLSLNHPVEISQRNCESKAHFKNKQFLKRILKHPTLLSLELVSLNLINLTNTYYNMVVFYFNIYDIKLKVLQGTIGTGTLV